MLLADTVQHVLILSSQRSASAAASNAVRCMLMLERRRIVRLEVLNDGTRFY
jgi:hypothetical protein